MDYWLQVGLFAGTLIIMLVGLFGLLVPVFPGIVVMWLAALVYGILTGFDTLAIVLFVLISLLMVAGTTVDNVLMGVGAHKGGASWVNIILAMVVGVVGTILVPPFGGLIGAPLVMLALEYRRQGDWQLAWQSLVGLAAGWGLSFLARFGIGLVILILWLVWAWKG